MSIAKGKSSHWLSILFEAGSEGNIFEESGENRGAMFSEGGGDDHAIGLEAAHLAWSEVGDDDDFAADELFGLVELGDPGEDLALFVAKIDFKTEELVSLGDALGDDDLGDAEVDLDEVVDGDLGGVGDVGLGGGVGKEAGGVSFCV
jgi:hypothetical protein